VNEVTKIHLGRQSFTIAVDAYKALQTYLQAIRHQVGDKGAEVAKEVEARMAELLAEHGVSGDKVVLVEDIDFLKEQLGSPKDFRDDEEGNEAPSEEDSTTKRLYRDEKNGMIAGVSSGLAAYFNIDAVIVRLIFILLTVVFGWGILVYILLWIIVPPAKSTSDRLKMKGKAVTIGSLATTVNREVSAAASRAGRASKATSSLIATFLKIVLGVVGVALATAAVCALFGLAVVTAYVLTHTQELIGGIIAFPVGSTEMLFVIAALVAGGIIALLLFLLGTAMIKRKWIVPGWVTASIIGLFLTAAALTAVMAPDAVNGVQDRYEKAHVITSRTVPAFTEVDLKGLVSFRYIQSDQYKVELRYLNKQDPETIATEVVGTTLIVDTVQFDSVIDCNKPCISTSAYPEAIIYAPSLTEVDIDGHSQMRNIRNGDHFRLPGQ
jgi:phage shock protein PspC (stress-responsive transcriptional regulator)